ncbi:unnamed protein product, partial [Rotaria sp. Silwood2]
NDPEHENQDDIFDTSNVSSDTDNSIEGLTDKPILPRQRRPLKHYDSNSRLPHFTTCEEFYHQQYIEALDIVLNMLRVRFT